MVEIHMKGSESAVYAVETSTSHISNFKNNNVADVKKIEIKNQTKFFSCGKFGHSDKECWSSSNKEDRNNCSRCGGKNHKTSECRSRYSNYCKKFGHTEDYFW